MFNMGRFFKSMIVPVNYVVAFGCHTFSLSVLKLSCSLDRISRQSFHYKFEDYPLIFITLLLEACGGDGPQPYTAMVLPPPLFAPLIFQNKYSIKFPI